MDFQSSFLGLDNPTRSSTTISGTYLGLCTGVRTRVDASKCIVYYTRDKRIGMIKERRQEEKIVSI